MLMGAGPAITVTRPSQVRGSAGRSQETLMGANRPTTAANEEATGVVADPLRESLRAIWASAASSWGEHAAYVDAREAGVTRAMLAAAGLRRGEHVLELAAGPGGVGIAAA